MCAFMAFQPVTAQSLYEQGHGRAYSAKWFHLSVSPFAVVAQAVLTVHVSTVTVASNDALTVSANGYRAHGIILNASSVFRINSSQSSSVFRGAP